MKYKIVSLDPDKNRSLIEELRIILDKKGTFFDTDFEYLFVIGGDGTLMHYIKEYAFSEKKIIGIKGGTVSFLTHSKIEDIFSKFDSFSLIELLKVEINKKVYYAFNDVFISGNSFLKSEIFINGEFFKHFRGSGLLFSTKIGSTAQNKSFLGPILFPGTNTWLINGIGSQSTNKFSAFYSSLVLSVSDKLFLRFGGNSFFVYLDGKPINCCSKEDMEIKIELIRTNSYLLFSTNTSNYLKKLTNSFLIV